MKSPSSDSFEDLVHDIFLVLFIPCLICVILYLGLFLFAFEGLRENTIYTEDPKHAVAVWHIVLISIVVTLLVSGRVSAFVWAKEEYFELRPHPLRIIRKYGLVFCWSDHLTYIFGTPFRRMRELRRKLPVIKLPDVTFPTVPSFTVPSVGRHATHASAWMRRKRRRFRIRLLWLMRRVKSMMHAPATEPAMARASTVAPIMARTPIVASVTAPAMTRAAVIPPAATAAGVFPIERVTPRRATTARSKPRKRTHRSDVPDQQETLTSYALTIQAQAALHTSLLLRSMLLAQRT